MKRILIAALAAVGLILGLSSPALAGGTGDFYQIKKCYAQNGYSISYIANLEISNYDDPYSAGQVYHIDMDGDTTTTPDIVSYRVYVGGAPFTVTNDFYWRDFNSQTADYDWTATWYKGTVQYRCDFRL